MGQYGKLLQDNCQTSNNSGNWLFRNQTGQWIGLANERTGVLVHDEKVECGMGDWSLEQRPVTIDVVACRNAASADRMREHTCVHFHRT